MFPSWCGGHGDGVTPSGGSGHTLRCGTLAVTMVVAQGLRMVHGQPGRRSACRVMLGTELEATCLQGRVCHAATAGHGAALYEHVSGCECVCVEWV